MIRAFGFESLTAFTGLYYLILAKLAEQEVVSRYCEFEVVCVQMA